MLQRAALSVALTLCGSALAAPVSLSASQFAAQTAGRTTVETFEGFSGSATGSLTLANGVFTSESVNIFTGFLCGGDTDKCMAGDFMAISRLSPRVFTALPSNTAYWGTDFFAVSATDVFKVDVKGLSGTTTFSINKTNTFFGVYDPLGLVSISFTNLKSPSSFGNYTFDNVTTAPAATALPEPATGALAALALAGLGWTRARRR